MRHKIASISQRLRLPSICVLCNQYHRDHVAVCSACLELLSPIGIACKYCALPLLDAEFLVCGHCCLKKPHYDRAIAAYHFEEPLRTLLHEFKYHEGLYLCSFFATLIMRSIPQDALKTQCLIPIPMHPNRLRQRGFNQSAELVKQLSYRLKLPYDISHCKKTINTAPQASLTAKQRQRNLRHAFHAEPLPYQHITLVDDLLTTGSTVNELANVLKQRGIERVDVWCCARTVGST